MGPSIVNCFTPGSKEVLATLQPTMSNCLKVASIPARARSEVVAGDSREDDLGKARMEAYPYRQVVGKLMYLAVCTRPDIRQSVSEHSRFNSNLGLKHWEKALCPNSASDYSWITGFQQPGDKSVDAIETSTQLNS